VYSFGEWCVAFPTIKVPLATAALRSDQPRAQDLVVKAVTESNNPASEKLWPLLGEPAHAAQQVNAIISESGDTATVVESRRLRPGFSAFGKHNGPRAGKPTSLRSCPTSPMRPPSST